MRSLNLSLLALLGTASLVVAGGCAGTSAREIIPAAGLYTACVQCHGPTGAGNALIGAPRVAGLPQWYIVAQLDHFQNGVRGKHPDDAEGLRMRAMSRQMLSKEETESVAGYVAQLPAVTNPATLAHANPATAQPRFVACAPCHGDNGQGNEQVKAPPIGGLDDWYVARQLRKFRTHVRGSAPGDALGPMMQAMASTIPAEQVDDMAAYVHSLPR